MTFQTDDAVALVERVAKAINGPLFPVPEGSKYSLDELRDVRWGRLSRQEQGERMNQARSVLALFQPSGFQAEENDRG